MTPTSPPAAKGVTEAMVEAGAKACRDITFNALTMDECRDAVRAALLASLSLPPPDDTETVLRDFSRKLVASQSDTDPEIAEALHGNRSEMYRTFDTAPLPPPGEGETLTIGYTNWRGEYAVRKIVPLSLWYGSTEWHPEPQWLITARDLEKDADRDFALSGFSTPAAPELAVKEPEPGTVRVCPKRDATCPHGLHCPYTDGYDCKPGWNTYPAAGWQYRASPQGEKP